MPKETKKVGAPDTMSTVGESNLIQKSKELLDAVVDSTKILEKTEMDEKGLKEASVVLGFLNAANNTMKTKMNYYKMMGVGDKVKSIKKRNSVFGR